MYRGWGRAVGQQRGQHWRRLIRVEVGRIHLGLRFVAGVRGRFVLLAQRTDCLKGRSILAKIGSRRRPHEYFGSLALSYTWRLCK